MATTARRRSLLGEKIGNYAIVSTLGEGGMGVVYLAEHPIIGRRVAIKVLHADHAAGGEAAGRCFVEARAIAEIRHPNVVDVIDCGVAELAGGPAHYLVMEHLEGRSLRDELRGGPLPVGRAIAIAVEVGRALAAAHDKGIVHRDIKPENIFLGAGQGAAPAVKVLDFGIAKLMDGHPFGGPLTQSGVTLGTPTYMAPEQLDGEDLDGRVDVYALGIVLFEMLTGAAPFADEPTARGVWRRMNEVPELPEGLELPEGARDLLLRALDPDRVRRPSMAELVRGLTDPAAAAAGADDGPHTLRVPRASAPGPRSRGGLASPAPPDRGERPAPETGLIRPSEPPLRRRWALVAAAGAIAVAGAAVLVSRPWRGGEAEPSAPVAAPVPPRSEEPVRPAALPAEKPLRPAEPVTVAIQLDSQPSGAEVFIDGERRGTTPLTLTLDRSSAPVPILLRRGRDEIRHEVLASSDSRLVFTFPAAQPPERPRPSAAGAPRPAPAASSQAAQPVPPAQAGSAPPPPPTQAAAPPSEPAVTPPRGLGDNLMQPRPRP